MPSFAILLAIGLVAVAALPAAETIRNDQITVTCDQGRYAVQFKGQDKPFATGRLRLTGGTVKVVAVKDPDFGQGQAIESSAPDGSCEALQIFPGLPFVLFTATLANAGNEAVVLNKVPLVDAALEPGTPLDQMVGLGTGGLKPLKENPGSYAWVTVADPRSRNGIVGGWLTHEHGSGVVFTKVTDGRLSMEARQEYGCLRIEPGKTVTSETFVLGWFADARLGLEAWADAVAKRMAIKLPPMPIVYCTWYDNEHNGSSNEKFLAELAAFAAKELKPYGFTCVQIDDGWQMGDSKGNGPAKNFSQYNPHGNYSKGMKPTADNLRSLGLTAGLWILPFGGSWNDPFFADHQDWFVKRKEDGKSFDTPWGGTALDMTQPGARVFVAGEVKQAVHEWGYRYLKLDGLSTGIGVKPMYIQDAWKEDNLGDAVFHDPTKTNIDAFRDGLRMVREAAGPETFILGCCAPQNMRSYAGVFGLVDAMRMGPDNGGSWSAWKGSADFGSRNYHLNGRIWWSDPDPIYVRASIPLESARCIASWNALSGQMISISDWLPTLPAEHLDILRRTIPGHGVTARPIDLFNTWPPREWMVTDQRPGHQRRDVIGLFNWTHKTENHVLPLADLGLPPSDEYIAFDFWNRVFLKPFKGTLESSVPGAACRILAVRPLLPRPFLLSTSRHVSQGIVEVLEEHWDEAGKTLSGRSRIVGGDPYELRIAAFAPGKIWSVDAVEVSGDDRAAGVKMAFTETGGCVRASIESAASREVNWSVRFKPVAATSAKPQAPANLKAGVDVLKPVELSWASVDGVSYEVVRDGGPVARTATACWTDESVEPEKTYQYEVTAVDFAGQRSESAKVSATTLPVPKPTPLPPVPDVHLSDLKAEKLSNGYGQMGINKSVDGKPLTVNGTKYEKGLGAHATAELIYANKPEYKRFVAVVGIDDEVRNDERPSLAFHVYADKKLLAESPKLMWRTLGYWHFDVEIPAGTRQIRLVVTDGGDGNACDHADLVNAGFKQ
jgi:hypothetical protein